MVIKRRIETQEAKDLRGKRQGFAAPGGSHDKLIGWLGKILPMGVGVIAALMVITPLSPRGEVSFLLDRNKVAMIDERLSVDNAMYRGEDNQGRPFTLTAGEAVQRSSREGVVRMTDLVASIVLPDGLARIGAQGGIFDIEQDKVSIIGPVRMTAADGYSMVARDVSVDLNERMMYGDGGVDGEVPAGEFSADRLRANMAERTITLDGNARMRMTPGKLRIP
ncbi:MAG: LPS export ABC transporter periplasmic protein LptC [Erythrobacter sp.]